MGVIEIFRRRIRSSSHQEEVIRRALTLGSRYLDDYYPQFKKIVATYKGRKIKRWDWLAGEFFVPDGSWTTPDPYAGPLMTGKLHLQGAKKRAMFKPSKNWLNESEVLPWSSEALRVGRADCGLVMLAAEHPDLPPEALAMNDEAVRLAWLAYQSEDSNISVKVWDWDARFDPNRCSSRLTIQNILLPEAQRVSHPLFTEKLCFVDEHPTDANVFFIPEGMKIGRISENAFVDWSDSDGDTPGPVGCLSLQLLSRGGEPIRYMPNALPRMPSPPSSRERISRYFGHFLRRIGLGSVWHG